MVIHEFHKGVDWFNYLFVVASRKSELFSGIVVFYTLVRLKDRFTSLSCLSLNNTHMHINTQKDLMVVLIVCNFHTRPDLACP